MSTPATPFLAADVGDILKGLFVLFILFGPVLRKIFERSDEKPAQGGPVPRPTREPRPPTPAASSEGMTWEDLLAGRGSVATAGPPSAEPVLPPAFEPHEHEELVPDGILGDLPSEGEIERHGGDLAAPPIAKVEDLESLHEFSTGEEQLVEDLPELGGLQRFREWEEAALPTSRPKNPWRPRAGDWKRSIVVAEVLAPSLAMRKGQSHPGPPLGLT